MNLWYSEKEKKIMEPFYKKIHEFLAKGKTVFGFMYNDSSLIVKYDTEADSDNELDLDDPNYEDFLEMYFQILKVEKKQKEEKYRKNKYLCINYHNIPDEFEVVDLS